MKPGRVKIIALTQGLRVMLLVVLVLAVGCSTWRSRAYHGGAYDLQMRPASGDTARLLRNAHYFKLMGRNELALKELEEAHQLDPSNLKVVNTLAECYEQLGRSDRAQQIYLEALARHQDNQALANNLCFSYYQAGNWQQAEGCFRQTLAREPNNTAARNNLGLLLCRQGRQEEARRLWQEAEGTAAAESKLSQVLASLGLTGQSPVQSATAGGAPGSPPRRQATAPAAAAAPSSLPPAPLHKGPALASAKPAGVPAAAAAPAPATPSTFRSRPEAPEKAALPAPVRKPGAARLKTPSPQEAPRESRLTGPTGKQPLAPVAPAAPAAERARVPEAAPFQANRAAAASPAWSREPQPGKAGKVADVLTAQEGTALPCRALTAQQLEETAIEVRNGNGTPHLARETRARLDLEGFTVVAIANHIDFGVDKTMIYYRPGAENVARALRAKFFQDAGLEPREKLAKNEEVDVRVILGHDLPRSHAKAGAGREEKFL